MARMSRMTKYKDLREGIKTDVVTSDSASVYTGQEKQVRDADYYKRFLNSDQVSQLEKPDPEDTLLESLTLDSINSQVDEELERALSRVREEAGQEDFNTRMDILNKIRQTKMAQEAALTQEEIKEPEIEEVELEEDDEEEEQSSGYRFGLFKRRQEDDEIEDEQQDEQEDEEEETSHRFRFGFRKRMAEVEEDDEEEELEEEEAPRKFRFGSKKRSSEIEEDELEEGEEEENSTFIKVLNGVIIVLSLILVALVGYIIKEFIF